MIKERLEFHSSKMVSKMHDQECICIMIVRYTAIIIQCSKYISIILIKQILNMTINVQRIRMYAKWINLDDHFTSLRVKIKYINLVSCQWNIGITNMKYVCSTLNEWMTVYLYSYMWKYREGATLKRNEIK